MTETPFPDRDLMRTARAVARNSFGAVLADKASDAFCLELVRSQSLVGVRQEMFLEGVASRPGTGPVRASVLEFGTSIDAADPTIPRTSVVAARTAAYGRLSAVYDEIERQSGMTVLNRDPGDVRTGASVLTTQVCWLNATVRTWADPRVVADVAADPSVTGIDVPRPLRADLPGPVGGAEAAGDAVATRNGHVAIGLEPGGPGGAGSIVAVIDSEVSSGHPAFQGRVVHRRNYTNEPWGNPASHGTAVAGLVASGDATWPGVVPEATIYNYKVLATNSLLGADDFGGALAIQQALEDGALVANCSWGAGPAGDGRSREARAVDAVWLLGLVVVKSAGNNGPGAATMTTPSDAAGVIAVAAADLVGTAVQDYSSRGPVAGRPGPHLAAPGGDNAALNLVCAQVAGGFGDSGAGTSYAAPCVTGAVARHLVDHPDDTPDDVRAHLVGAARPMPGVGDDAQGAGLLWVGA